MGPNEYSRLIVHSFILSAIATLALLTWSYPVAAGFGVGAFWSATNFWILKQIFTEFLVNRRALRLFLLTQLKIMWYGIGAIALFTIPMSYGAGIAGFHLPFVVLIVEAVLHQRRMVPADDNTSSRNDD